MVEKRDGKRPLGRSRRRWENNIKMDFMKMTSDDVVWNQLGEDREQWRALVNTIMNYDFHKRRAISLSAQRRLSTELVNYGL
jgi:hypothetical protein